MFTQFFGSYLLNQELVDLNQLKRALELQMQTKVKLGILAINAGYMTAQQVDVVHNTQARVDKRFGDLAVENGFVTDAQVSELLGQQQIGYLILGQALVDLGALSNADFEKHLKEYKENHKIINAKSDGIEDSDVFIADFYNTKKIGLSDEYSDYISLLLKNLIRFIGSDFTPLKPELVSEYKSDLYASQEMCGGLDLYTAIDGDSVSFMNFAERFSNDVFENNDEFTQAAVSEFLNLHNGLFAVNMSNEKQLEIEMKAQNIGKAEMLPIKKAVCLPISFSFGTVNFVLSY